MADQLSPANQVMIAVAYVYQEHGGEPPARAVAAAALRAVADQVKPSPTRTPWLTNEDGYFNETFENMEALGEMNAYYKILAIADELEGIND